MELNNIIKTIIQDTIARLEFAYKYNQENKETNDKADEIKTRIVFPKKNDGTCRISEQELRFAFIEAFNNYCNDEKNKKDNKGYDLYYSVETPTKDMYADFKTDPKKSKDFNDETKGRSAEFDAVLYQKKNDKLERICLLEFKANNANKIDHIKDVIKFNNEEEGDKNVLRYFIEIVKSYNNDTLESLNEKMYVNENDNDKEKYKHKENYKHNFICYSLEKKEEIIKKYI